MPDSPPRRRSATVPVAVAVVAALIAVVTVFAKPAFDDGGTPRQSAGQPSATPESTNGAHRRGADQRKHESAQERAQRYLASLARRTPGDPLAKGDVDAPVVMIEFSDFQCPFCGKFARDTEPTLFKKYVDSGTLRFEWRDFPYLGEESHTAALAGRAAARQGGFWKFHDALYARQAPPNSGTLTTDHLVEVAESVGLNGPRLRMDMKTDKVRQAVDRDFAKGQSIGVTGTPAFLINGRPVMGAQPLKVFEKLIDQAAAEAR